MEKQQYKEMVSVIVPVYKVERYLERCVISIISQTYSNLEIILVDDGSPDNCPQMCDDFMKMDPRIKVVHKLNGGLSDARNAGIDIATGKYLYFVDSDDMIAEQAIELAVICAETNDAEIVINTKKKNNNKYNMQIGDARTMYQAIFNQYCWEAWGKLFTRELVKDLMFPVGKLYEDIGYVPYAVLKASRVAILDNGTYYYTQREDSIMGKSKETLSCDLVEVFDLLTERVKRNNPDLFTFTITFALVFLYEKYRTIKNNIEQNTENQKYVAELKKYARKHITKVCLNYKLRIPAKIRLICFVLRN